MLITIVIIGVVAALTIPALVERYEQYVVTTKLKKTYAVLNNAYRLAVIEHGTYDRWGMQESKVVDGKVTSETLANQDKLWEYISPYLKVSETCKTSDGTCNILSTNGRYNLHGKLRFKVTNNKVAAIRLNDGVILEGGYTLSPNCTSINGTSRDLRNVCADFAVYLSGKKEKYTIGKDLFYFYVTKNAIVPQGTVSDIQRRFPKECARKSPTGVEGLNGFGCAAWVIEKGNMDYLKCDDLSWIGKDKCN